jgi:hypothetical protein
MRQDAEYIMATALKAVQPDAAVAKALQGKRLWCRAHCPFGYRQSFLADGKCGY